MLQAGLRLKELRLSRGFSGRELARRIHINHAYLHRVEDGTSRLSYRVLIEIQDVLRLNEEETDQLMDLADPQVRMSILNRSEDHRKRRVADELSIEARAQLLLQEYGMLFEPISRPPIPFRLIADKLLGLKIIEVANLPDGVDAQLVVADKVILLNSDRSSLRKAFSCCHELGHWVLHQGRLTQPCRVGDERDILVVDNNAPEAREYEIQAHMFAAAIRMPAPMVLDVSRDLDLGDMNNVTYLAGLFEVSFEAMRIRLARLGLPQKQ